MSWTRDQIWDIGSEKYVDALDSSGGPYRVFWKLGEDSKYGVDSLPPQENQRTQYLHHHLGHYIDLPRKIAAESDDNDSRTEVGLQFLIVDLAHMTKLPSTITEILSLRQLFIECNDIAHLPEALGNLAALQVLSISGCFKLQDIPSSIGTLSNLEELSIEYCGGLTCLPEEIGSLSALKTLKVESCTKLIEFPKTICTLTALTALTLSGSYDVESLPRDIGDMKGLKTLTLESLHKITRLPSSIGTLTALKTLSLSFCKGLEQLPDSFGGLSSLETLSLEFCDSLKHLPDSFTDLSSLVTVTIAHCPLITSFLPQGVGCLDKLQEISIVKCGVKRLNMQELSALPAIKKIRLK